jgi:hypothetical protein
MKKLTAQPVITYKVGDRIQFFTFDNERGMSTYTNTEYGIITKVNIDTVLVKTKTDKYRLNIDELTHYVDPFAGWE